MNVTWNHEWQRIGAHCRTTTFMCARCRLVLDALMPFEHLYQASSGVKLDADPGCLSPPRPVTPGKS